MGWWKSTKKRVKKATKGITKAVGNVLEAPVDVVSGTLDGDINRVLNGVVKAGSMGIWSYDKGGLLNVTDAAGQIVGDLTGANAAAAEAEAQAKNAQEALLKQQADAKAAAIARRRFDLEGDTVTNYTTALGDFSGNMAGKTKKKTVLGG